MKTIITILLFMVSLSYIYSQNSTKNQTKHTDKKKKQLLEKIKKLYNQKLIIYGKVVDEKRNPVKNAKIDISPTTEYFSKGKDKSYFKNSDAKGNFFFSGRGLDAYTKVIKDGYYRNPKSYMSIKAGNGSTKENPIIFTLIKRGIAEPLIKTDGKIRLSKKGIPVGINFKTGKNTSLENADIIVQLKSSAKKIKGYKPFNWSAIINFPHGGFIKRNGEFYFVAPVKGYKKEILINMPSTLPREKWKHFFEGEYFLKLKEGNYARVKLKLSTRWYNDVLYFESYLNPSGSRNLEYDPAKEIK